MHSDDKARTSLRQWGPPPPPPPPAGFGPPPHRGPPTTTPPHPPTRPRPPTPPTPSGLLGRHAYVSHPIVITAHRRHVSPIRYLINVSASGKIEKRCCRKGQFPRCGNLTFTAAILSPNALAAWGRVCIFREGERGRRENARQRGGVTAKPLPRNDPRNPQLPHSSVVASRNPLQNREFCRTGPARDALLCCQTTFYGLISTGPNGRYRPLKSRSGRSLSTPSRGGGSSYDITPVGPVSCPTPTLLFMRNVSLLPSFRLRKFRLIFAGTTDKYLIFLWQTIPVQPM